MYAKTRHDIRDFKPCVPGALGGGLARTAYYDGMVLSEADMLREQSYWRAKRRLTNRALGQGVVWGLGLRWEASSRRFLLAPGYGLSCCGDDLVVECPESIAESELIEVCGGDFRRLMAHAGGKLHPCDKHAKPDGPVEACVMLEYVECPEDPRQVFEDPCAERAQGCRFGAVRETTRLRLVPPPPPAPPGAMEAFCEKIDAIRAELAAEAVFEPLMAMDTRSLRVVAAYMTNTSTPTVISGAAAGLELAPGATASLGLPDVPVGGPRLRIGLEPPPGYVFTRAEVGGVPLAAVDALMGASVTLPSVPTTASATPVMVAHVELSPLFGTGPVHEAQVSIAFAPALTGTESAPPTVTATLVEYSATSEARHDCSSLLADGVLLAGPGGCTLRTLVLGVLCGWFKSALLDAPCAAPKETDETDPSAEARLLLAWVICRVAWRALFGIDIVVAHNAGLEKCLHQLLRAWCEGFHYKGPRCDCHAHGIILGCVQVSPSGRILCFDEWMHRRHVLTGPLLTHWAGQFGLAPPDAGIARLARWVCCVASAPLPELPEGVTLPDPSVLPVPGGAFVAGPPYAQDDRVNGVPVQRAEEVSGMEFVSRALDILFSKGASMSAASSLSAFSAPGGTLQLLVPAALFEVPRTPLPPRPAPMAAGGGRAHPLLAEIGRRDASLPAMVRQPLEDFVDALADAIRIDQLKPRAGAPLFASMGEALGGKGIATVSDLMRVGPESALARVRASVSENDPFADLRTAEKTIALVYGAAAETLAGAAEAVAARAAKADELDPFTRADLEEAATLGAVRKAVNAHLRDRSGLSTDALKGVAARAVARRP
jgi:hypothetical protein